jgi:TetR/AcrR family transcriptional repressor of nem operon
MLQRGFSATSLDEVCTAAEVTKGSLFHYFASKEELGAAVLERYIAVVFAKFDAIRAQEPDPFERVKACQGYLMDSVTHWPLSEGCILGRFTQELAETHPGIRALCAREFERWIATMTSDLEQAAKQRRLRGINARSLAEYAIASFEGALILARAQRDCAVVVRALEHTSRYLDMHFERRR